jgi:hypothetical protein
MNVLESSPKYETDPLANWMRKERRRLRIELWQWLEGKASTTGERKGYVQQPGIDLENGFSRNLALDVSVSTNLSHQLELAHSEGNEVQG